MVAKPNIRRDFLPIEPIKRMASIAVNAKISADPAAAPKPLISSYFNIVRMQIFTSRTDEN